MYKIFLFTIGMGIDSGGWNWNNDSFNCIWDSTEWIYMCEVERFNGANT